MMLPTSNRIKAKGRIEEVMRKGKMLQSPNFGVALLGNNDNTPKFAFVTSTKISKLAVHRNRINRSFNEGIRRAMNMVPAGFDFVFLAKKSIADKPTDEIIKEVNSFFSGIKV